MKTAMYLRCSKEEMNNRNPGSSINRQKMLLYSFAANRKWDVIEYSDEGYDGENFNRPAFRAMLEDAKRGKIQTIMVMDKSIIGSDFDRVSDYIGKIFPMLNVRFISVSDKYDSETIWPDNGNNQTVIPVDTDHLYTEMYGKMLSKKMRNFHEESRKNGHSTAGQVPFGYVKDKENPGKWLIDPEAGTIIRKMFELAVSGWNTTQIAHYLNDNHYPVPMVYNRTHGNWKEHKYVTKESERLWTSSSVSSYLKRYEYTGAKVMGKSQILAACSRSVRRQSEANWTVIEGVNEGIVTREEYELAQQAIPDYTIPAFKGSRNYALKGKVRCGNCRRCLRFEDSGLKEYFICGRKAASGKESTCSGEKYPADYINRVVLNELNVHLKECNLDETEVQEAKELTKEIADRYISNIYIYSMEKFEIEYVK